MSDETILDRALQILAEPCTCTELGERLWRDGSRRRVNRQSYARPAGRIVRRLVDAGLVTRAYPRGSERRPAQYQAIRILTCWSCDKRIEKYNSYPVVGVPEIRICEACDGRIVRSPAKVAGDAIREFQMKETGES
jgi:hypothetical protein